MIFVLTSLVGVVLVIIWVIRADAGHSMGTDVDDAVHLAGIKRPALVGAEHGCIRGRLASNLTQGGPGVGREQHDAGLAALAVGRDLSGPVALGHIAPAQTRDLGDAQAGPIEERQQSPISGVRLQVDHEQGVWLGQDAVSQRVLDRRRLKDLAEVEAKIADLLAKGEQGLKRSDRIGAGGGSLALQGGKIRLHVSEPHEGERLGDKGQRVGSLRPVFAPGVGARETGDP